MNADSKVYVFIAKNASEFDRYPGELEEFNVNRDYRLPYRHRRVSDKASVLILDSFGEKERLKLWIGGTAPRDAYLRFMTIVFSVVKRVLGLTRNQFEAFVFVHFGDVSIDAAGKLVDRKTIDGRLCKAPVSVIDFANRYFPKYSLYALSSTDPLKRLDLNAPKILLPDSEDGLKQLVDRFEYNLEKCDWENVKQAFEKRWAIDSSADGDKKAISGQEYCDCCKALGIVVKEETSDE